MQGKQSCSVISKLTVDCKKDRYERSGTICVLKAENATSDQGHLVRGIVIGTVLALCVGLLLYFHRNICVVIFASVLNSRSHILRIHCPQHSQLGRYYVKKNSAKAKKILLNFLKVEVKLALMITSEGWDFSTCVLICGGASCSCLLVVLHCVHVSLPACFTLSGTPCSS